MCMNKDDAVIVLKVVATVAGVILNSITEV